MVYLLLDGRSDRAIFSRNFKSQGYRLKSTTDFSGMQDLGIELKSGIPQFVLCFKLSYHWVIKFWRLLNWRRLYTLLLHCVWDHVLSNFGHEWICSCLNGILPRPLITKQRKLKKDSWSEVMMRMQDYLRFGQDTRLSESSLNYRF